jgi:hypothetical protein
MRRVIGDSRITADREPARHPTRTSTNQTRAQVAHPNIQPARQPRPASPRGLRAAGAKDTAPRDRRPSRTSQLIWRRLLDLYTDTSHRCVARLRLRGLAEPEPSNRSPKGGTAADPTPARCASLSPTPPSRRASHQPEHHHLDSTRRCAARASQTLHDPGLACWHGLQPVQRRTRSDAAP